MIWAEAHDRVIGADGGIPWRLPGEQAHLQGAHDGRDRGDGPGHLGVAAGPGPPAARPAERGADPRPGWHADGAEVARSVEDVLARFDDVWVIGGAAIYAAFIPFADLIVRTEIDLDVDGDTYAPALSDEWVATPLQWQTTPDGVKFRVVELRRENP